MIMRIHVRNLILVLGISLASVTAFAGNVIPVVKTEDVLKQQAQIHDEIIANAPRYQTISKNNREAILSRQERLKTLLANTASTAELSDGSRTEVFNHLEWIEAVINGKSEDAMICRNTKVIGSNRMKKVCKTIAQLEREREAARSITNEREICMDCKSN